MKTSEITFVRRLFEPGDWVKIKDNKDLNKSSTNKFKKNPSNLVIASNNSNVKLQGFSGSYSHDRFELDVKKTRESKINSVLGDKPTKSKPTKITIKVEKLPKSKSKKK